MKIENKQLKNVIEKGIKRIPEEQTLMNVDATNNIRLIDNYVYAGCIEVILTTTDGLYYYEYACFKDMNVLLQRSKDLCIFY